MNDSIVTKSHAAVTIPEWIEARSLCGLPKFESDTSKLEFLIGFARANAVHGAGAPLAAGVFRDDGSLVTIAVDAPGMGGHEMSNALLLASNLVGSTTLRSRQNWELVSLAPPCTSCLGHIFSERPRRFVCSVSHEVVRRSLGLPDILFPGPEWSQILTGRGISVTTDVLRENVQELLTTWSRDTGPV